MSETGQLDGSEFMKIKAYPSDVQDAIMDSLDYQGLKYTPDSLVRIEAGGDGFKVILRMDEPKAESDERFAGYDKVDDMTWRNN